MFVLASIQNTRNFAIAKMVKKNWRFVVELNSTENTLQNSDTLTPEMIVGISFSKYPFYNDIMLIFAEKCEI